MRIEEHIPSSRSAKIQERPPSGWGLSKMAAHFLFLGGKEKMYEEGMFAEPGKKIKVIAKILFWVMTISFVILAFALGREEDYSHYRDFESHIVWPVFLLFLIGGPISAYVSSLILYAFGDLVENAYCTRRQLDDINTYAYTIKNGINEITEKKG